jgi:hypothetical protein
MLNKGIHWASALDAISTMLEEEDDEYMSEEDAGEISPKAGGGTSLIASPMNGLIQDDKEVKPYPSNNQLEYLEECFQMVALMVRGNAARIKDDMKKERALNNI